MLLNTRSRPRPGNERVLDIKRPVFLFERVCNIDQRVVDEEVGENCTEGKVAGSS